MRNYAILLACAAGIITATGCSHKTGSASRTAGPVTAATTTPGVIPPGTPIEVRTNEAIEADPTAAGHTYSANVTREIIGADGKVLVPKGAPAELVIQGAEEGGPVTGDKVHLGLRSITVGGKPYEVETTTTTAGGGQGVGANQRTARWVGGGAALGTLVGAVAGGGTGAVIGGAVGAAGGATGQVLTKGDTVRVPAETVLTYRLDQPLHLKGYPAQ